MGLRDAVLWPTPTAQDEKASGAAGYSTASGRHPGTTLTDATVGPRGQASRNTSGSPPAPCRLNPDWVETLLGFPVGWTDVPAAAGSKPSGTPSSPRSRKPSGGPS